MSTILIGTPAEFRKYISANASIEIEVLRPHIAAAQTKFIKPILGETLYNLLLAAYDDETGTVDNDDLEALLPYVQSPLARFAFVEGMSELSLNISNSGIRRIEDDNNKTPYQYQTVELKREKLTQAYDEVDQLLNFLTENIATYPTWEESDAFTNSKAYYINTAEEFSKYINIRKSYQTFSALLLMQKKVEDFYIRTRLGDAFHAALKAEIASGTISSETETILAYIRPAVAHFTIARAATELPLEIRADGFWVNTIAATMGNIKEKKQPDADVLANKTSLMMADAEQYMRNLITYLNANASGSLYADWYNSTFYVEPTDTTRNTEYFSSSTTDSYSAL